MEAGFIGLGNIGKPMAEQLVKKGFKTTVFDVMPKACESLKAEGARVANSPAEVAANADVIGVCVRNDADVESVLQGEDGIFSAARAGALIMIHSTVNQKTILDMALAGEKHHVSVTDVPMTGGAGGAAAGTLCYMFGGTEADFIKAQPFLNASAEKIVHTGGTGSGMAMKLCNNLMTYAAFVAMHEADKLAKACDLSFDVLKAVGQHNGVITPQMQTFIEGRNALYDGCSLEDFRGMFAGFAALGKKDLQAALDSANQLGVSLPATEKNHQLIEAVFFNDY